MASAGTKRNYVGLACTWHDPAVAVVDSRGELVFAEATERRLQKKRAHHSAPDELVGVLDLIDEWCEADADLLLARTWTSGSVRSSRWALRGIDALGRLTRIGVRRDGGGPVPRGFRRLPYSPRPGVTFMRYGVDSHVHAVTAASSALWRGLRWRATRELVARRRAAGAAGRGTELATDALLPGRRVYLHGYDHHLTHAATACYTSPFEEAVCVIVDGYAEKGSTSFFRYRDGRLEQLERRKRSWTSLGLLYGLICMACGFDPVEGEEWKVMGLAPYGRFDAGILDLLAPTLEVDGLRFVSRRNPATYGSFLAALASYPAADLAHTGQEFFRRRMEELLGNVGALGVSKNLVLGGGCALNSAANGTYLGTTPFERLHVYCAPGDDGNAVGAALQAFHDDHPGAPPRCEVGTPYLGSAMSAEALERLVRLGRPPGHGSWPGRVHERAARLLADGRIVGWVQGRAEFGPRALGNRSILADPRRADVKDVLNERVKFREEFRPFAPSILHEHGPEYFEDYQESPYMERTLRFRESVREKVPGVVHVDGTGRLQTVRREWNERYYELIAEFHRLTGVPLVLNTSFNVMGKPIIHGVEDALAVFYTSGLDALVIHDEVIEKRP
jgi:carbamoyltransferase